METRRGEAHHRHAFLRARGWLLAALLGPLLAASTPSLPIAAGEQPEAQSSAAGEDRPATTATEATWSRQAEESIHDSEYEITWQEETYLDDLARGWQAPNRAHGFRTYFTESGIRVIPRASGKPAWEWGLSLIGYGRGERIARVSPASIYPRGSRIEYRRVQIAEEYLNEERGIEQRFTLTAPPEECGLLSGGPSGEDARIPGGRGSVPGEEELPAYLVLALRGTLSAMPSADGRAIDFTAPGGAPVIRYAGLEVHDATGREIPARMEAFVDGETRGIRLVVEDLDAVYPVVIDPLATSPSWTGESDQASAQFGYFVATAGDVNGDGFSDVIIGAPTYDNGQTDEGRAFVYLGSASGLSATPAWTAESDQASAELGHSLGTAGDVNGDGYSDGIIGAPYFDNGQTDEGRAYVYLGSASGLSATPAWKAEPNQAGALCGFSVSTAGDVNGDGYADVILGGPSYNNMYVDQGRAWVFYGSASGVSTGVWREINAAGAGFGSAVSTAGDMNGDGYSDVIVGAPLYSNPEAEEGGVWIFNGSSAGLSAGYVSWWQGDQAGAHMGASVTAAGDYDGDGYADIIFGVPGYSNGQAGEGAIGSFRGGAGDYPGGLMSFQTDQAGAQFGASVAAAGDVNGDGYADVVVGAPGFDNGQTDEGRAYLFVGAGGGLFMNSPWTLESDQAGAGLGQSVATAGDVNGDGNSYEIIGIPGFDNGQTDEGRAQVHLGSGEGLTSLGWNAEINQASAQFGFSVAMAGDVNGDGYTDVLVGAPYYDNGQTDEGRAFLFYGSVSGPNVSSSWHAEGDQATAWFGYALASAGDVNGDGYSDVIIGAYQFDNVETNEGKAFVYHGSATGLATTPAWTAEGNQASAQFGRSVATAGDVNGDGFSDVIVGAPYYDNVQNDEGRAFLYSGSATGLSATAGWTAECNQASALFGFSVATAGDVNADGFSDLIIGAYNFDNGQANEGRAFVYHGSATVPPITPSWTAESNQASAWFGYSVSTAGDVNGDGYSDVVIGAPYYDNGATDEGMVFLYYGSASGLAAVKGWTEEGEQGGAHLGWVVCGAGDVNGDGYGDLCAGGNQYDAGTPAITDAGIATVNYGSATGPRVDVWDFATVGDLAGVRLGQSMAGGGDVDGDGYGDLIVGAPLYDYGQTDEGRLYFYNGGGWFHYLSTTLQQRRADGSAPIDHLGASESSSGFRISLRGRSIFGRTRIHLEWEVKPLRTLFNGAGTQRSAAWIDTGAGGAAVSEPVTLLSPDTVYHWRARVRYDPAATPFQPAGPWFTPPWNGWQEADLRTSKIVDHDGDGHFSDSDCNDGNPGIWGTPGEVVGLVLQGDASTLSWIPPADPGGLPSTLLYDTLRSSNPADFNSAVCIESNEGSDASAQDPATPATDALFAYLVRAENACPNGQGPLGNQSNGTPREGRACP